MRSIKLDRLEAAFAIICFVIIGFIIAAGAL
jgi:hypothetical protein